LRRAVIAAPAALRRWQQRADALVKERRAAACSIAQQYTNVRALDC
jgi:hypothetical protein